MRAQGAFGFMYVIGPALVWVIQGLTLPCPSSYMQARLYIDDLVFNSESIFMFTLSSGDNIQITGIQDYIDTKMAAELAAAAASSNAKQ